MEDVTRINVRVTKEFNKKLDTWAARLGLNKSQLCTMALQAGLNNIVRSISPEEVLTPDVLKMIMDIAKQQEANNDVPTNRGKGDL